MILSAQTIRMMCHADVKVRSMIEKYPEIYSWKYPEPLISPFKERSVSPSGKSYGLSSAGYDIRISKIDDSDRDWELRMDTGDFVLASSVEHITMPDDTIAIIHDKSSWAREGLCVQNTVLEPGWCGYITLELSFHRKNHHIVLRKGDPIAQLVFHRLDAPTEQPYSGKYQNQEDRPVEAKKEERKDNG